MADQKRPRIRIRFKYNRESGEIEELIIDDSAPAAGEAYHDQIAQAIAAYLGRQPDIEDAGPIRLRPRQAQPAERPAADQAQEAPGEQQSQTG